MLELVDPKFQNPDKYLSQIQIESIHHHMRRWPQHPLGIDQGRKSMLANHHIPHDH